MSEDRLMIRSQEEWWKWSFERGTSGDMVVDILEDWKKERGNLLSSLEEANKEIERLKEELCKIKSDSSIGKLVFDPSWPKTPDY